MSHSSSVTETLKFTEARQHLSRLVNRVARGETRVLIEKSGVPVAALVSTEDLKRLAMLDERRDQQFAGLARISDRFADISEDNLEREIARAVAGARADLRARLPEEGSR